MFRFGVLGVSGFALRKMIPAMRQARGVELVAISSRDGGKAAETARTLGLARSYGSYEELIADPEIDAVYNPLPNHLHVSWSERAADAGKHVLCEKPIALGVAEGRRLLAARERNGTAICEAAMVRVHPRWLAVRDLLRCGRIGELRAFIGTFGYNIAARDNIRFDAAMGGGVLLDTGFYPLTMSRFCFEDEPTGVLARSECDPTTGVDLLTSAVLQFPGGQATFSCGMALAPMQRALLLGTGGHLDLPTAWTPPPDRPSELTIETSASLEEPTPERLTFEPINQYTRLVERFVDSAIRGAPSPVPLEDSIHNLAALDALARSAKSGRWESPERP